MKTDTVARLLEMKCVLVQAIERESCPKTLKEYRQAYSQVMRLLWPDIKEFWDERAAIIEIESQVSRQYAEELALRDTCKRFGLRDLVYEQHLASGVQLLNELLELVTPQRSQLLIELDRICSAPSNDAEVAPNKPDEKAIVEFWRERCGILQTEAGNSRTSAEVIARLETSLHFGFCCIAIVQAERKRLETIRQLAALPGVTTGRQMLAVGRVCA